MTDTTTLAPTDADLIQMADDFDVGYTSKGRLLVGTNPDCDFTSQVLSFTRAAIAKWGAPAPASGEAVPTELIAGLERCEFDDGCEFCNSPEQGVFTRLVHNAEDVTEAEFYICGGCLHQAVNRFTKPAAPPAQEALLNPDMPTQELRLHMGELTTDEVLVARAAIRWANTYGITAAQKEAP